MTLEELENSLPNGLHDSEVRSILVDYLDRQANMQLCVWVGKLDDPPDKREAYKEGSLVISGLLFAVIEAPDSRYPFTASAKVRIDACDMRKNLGSSLLAALPIGSFVRSFFVSEWNASVHIAGLSAELLWRNEGKVTYRKQREHFLPGEIIQV